MCRCWSWTTAPACAKARHHYLQYIADQVPAKKPPAPANGTPARYQLQSWLTFVGMEIHRSFGPLFNPPRATSSRLRPATSWQAASRWTGTGRQTQYPIGDQFTVADACYLFTTTNWAKAHGGGPASALPTCWPTVNAWVPVRPCRSRHEGRRPAEVISPAGAGAGDQPRAHHNASAENTQPRAEAPGAVGDPAHHRGPHDPPGRKHDGESADARGPPGWRQGAAPGRGGRHHRQNTAPNTRPTAAPAARRRQRRQQSWSAQRGVPA